ncbi:MAG: TolC family protein [Deltaproteobacteria bacterium]|nr:TolC family protein [Deltaproteobacteria bacterium]
MKRAIVVIGLQMFAIGSAFAGSESPTPLKLSLTDCLTIALKADSNIRLLRLTALDEALDVDAEVGRFFPTVSASVLGFVDRNFPVRAQNGTILDRHRRSLTYGAGIQGLTPIGLTYGVELSSGINWNSADSFTRYGASLEVVLRQPLLRGAGIAANLYRLRVAKLGAHQTEQALQVRRKDLFLRVVAAYWGLFSRREELKISKKSLELAEEQLKATEKRVRLGNLSPLDLVEARAAIAVRKQERVRAAQAVLDAERALLLLLYRRTAHGETIDLRRRIIPGDTLRPVDERRSLHTLIAIADTNRPELNELRVRVQRAELQKEGSENSTLPSLSFDVGFGSWSEPVDFYGLLGDVNRDQSGAWGDLLTFRRPYLRFGLTFSLPLSARAREVTFQRSVVGVRRARESLAARHASLAVEVRDAYFQLRDAGERVAAARVREKLAEQNLDAMEKKFRGGISTSFDVLRSQVDLANAGKDLAQALTQQAVLHAELEASIGRLAAHLGMPHGKMLTP